MKILLFLIFLICSFSLRINVHLQEHEANIDNKGTKNNQTDVKNTEDDSNHTDTQSDTQNTDLRVFPFQLTQKGLPGGWTGRKVTSQVQLNQTEKALWGFTVTSYPQILDESLVSIMTQLVAGTNTCFNVIESGADKLVSYCVWYQPWNNNFMQLTTPYGDIFQSGGQQ